MPSPGSSDRESQIVARLIVMLDQRDAKARKNIRSRDRVAYVRAIPITLVAQVGTPIISGYARNLSTGGAGILCRRSFKLGERFATELQFGATLGKLVLCRVVFCRYVAECMYEVGAQFEATAPKLNEHSRYPQSWIGQIIESPVSL